jgi:hypothetical protein
MTADSQTITHSQETSHRRNGVSRYPRIGSLCFQAYDTLRQRTRLKSEKVGAVLLLFLVLTTEACVR